MGAKSDTKSLSHFSLSVSSAQTQHQMQRGLSVFPVSVFTKICIAPPRRRSTKCNVDSFWMVSLGSTSSVIVFPVRVLTKICIAPPRRRSTKCSVDSFWRLESDSVRPSSSCLPAKM